MQVLAQPEYASLVGVHDAKASHGGLVSALSSNGSTSDNGGGSCPLDLLHLQSLIAHRDPLAPLRQDRSWQWVFAKPGNSSLAKHQTAHFKVD